MNNLSLELEKYISKNFGKNLDTTPKVKNNRDPDLIMHGYVLTYGSINFNETYRRNKTETFSEMLLRLIEESGEKASEIYGRAQIERQHFSKIRNNPNYRPTKQTVLAFVIALKLNLQQAENLLSAAGFTLTNSIIGDVIVKFFIEHEFFDITEIDIYLDKYEEPTLGGR